MQKKKIFLFVRVFFKKNIYSNAYNLEGKRVTFVLYNIVDLIGAHDEMWINSEDYLTLYHYIMRNDIINVVFVF